ncbi:DUF2939 domain-containing protein [Vogesella indigofera]|uniref:DUF2939 domain-containing protein n=1 Tax=Vogesella indigofera TaxID=45465 RepID=UPI00234F7367|nr:DUF2939 domain-containing protein [Vogesella indigofera]MDC7711811.1 DUF2939 domain-containing protein [Vogesella indigofera]
MDNKLKGGLTLAAIAVISWFYYTPYLAIQGMQNAAQERNATKLASYVDFPVVKENLKTELNGQMLQKLQGNPFAAVGVVFAGALVNTMVDVIVSPQGLAMMMRGEKPLPAASAEATDSSTQEQANEKVETKMGYDGLSQFTVKVYQRDKPDQAINLVLQRHNLVSWQLTEIRLPQ